MRRPNAVTYELRKQRILDAFAKPHQPSSFDRAHTIAGIVTAELAGACVVLGNRSQAAIILSTVRIGLHGQGMTGFVLGFYYGAAGSNRGRAHAVIDAYQIGGMEAVSLIVGEMIISQRPDSRVGQDLVSLGNSESGAKA